ncbi:hypothetical protein BpHYR1_023529 [Brachionus plicatilis]|uniref:Uncharacterized protein n=1 Tax=Brachionus plicatilis TaxID=10195 RepID=A0A3M7SCC5_BRAPC|nr:hypothetical protein BpHYR1_023529 [Brachionus plicatilis]
MKVFALMRSRFCSFVCKFSYKIYMGCIDIFFCLLINTNSPLRLNFLFISCFLAARLFWLSKN